MLVLCQVLVQIKLGKIPFHPTVLAEANSSLLFLWLIPFYLNIPFRILVVTDIHNDCAFSQCYKMRQYTRIQADARDHDQ